MNRNTFSKDGNQVIISSGKSPLVIRIVLFILVAICGLLPLVVTFAVLTFGDGPHIGIAFGYLFFWGIGIYLLRILLWNSFGRELITLYPDKLEYLTDYKYFKDARKNIGRNDLIIEFLEHPEDENRGIIVFQNDEMSFTTSLYLKLEDLDKIANLIVTHYKTTYPFHLN